MAKTQRTIVSYPFEDGGAVSINVTGDVDTKTALDIATTLIELKRKELGPTKATPLRLAGERGQ